MNRVMYPQSALEGFAGALNGMLGVNVSFTSGSPCTDGTMITLPRITGALTQEEFEAYCGVALHEAAHVAIGSVPVFQRYARRGCAHADAMNAVLDVADETRVEHLLQRAEALFYANACEAAKKALEADAFSKSHPRWIVLAGGIFLTRNCGRFRTNVKAALEKSPHWDTIVKVWQVLWKARTRRSRKLRMQRGSHATLKKLADRIVEILKQAGLDQEDQMVLVPYRGGNLPTDTAEAPVDSSDTLAGHAEGEAVFGTRTSGGMGQGEEREQKPFDESTRTQVAATVGGVMSRMVWSKDADGDDEGFASGKRIGRNIERAVIDGRCFTRPALDEGEKLHAVILLDRSGSMREVIGTVGGVAQGFADAVRRVAETVQLGVFSHRCEAVQDFRDVTAGGGTATDEAIEWATKELDSKRGRRLILCITDGVPGRTERTIEACNAAGISGIDVVGVAYGMSAASLRASMGTATIIEAHSPVELACGLSRVAARVGA